MAINERPENSLEQLMGIRERGEASLKEVNNKIIDATEFLIIKYLTAQSTYPEGVFIDILPQELSAKEQVDIRLSDITMALFSLEKSGQVYLKDKDVYLRKSSTNPL